MNHLKKSLCLLLCVVMALAALTGCSGTGDKNATKPTATTTTAAPAAKTALSVAGIQGPTGVGLANLMETGNTSAAIDYTFNILSSPDEVVAKFSTGEANIASVPTNLAAKLYKKLNGDVQMLAVNTAGVLYMLENGDTVHSVADLRGKTIYSTGEGANPEYVLRHVLQKNGLDPDRDVTITYLTENSELITKLATGEAQIAMVPEPAATTVMTKNANLRIALSMDSEWNAVSPDSRMFMGCVIAKKSFVEQNKAAIDAFLTEYKASIEKATADVDGTAALCEKHGIIAAAAIAKNAIPRCNLVYLDGAEMKTTIAGYYQVLFAADPTSIGGAMPNDDFYYSR